MQQQSANEGKLPRAELTLDEIESHGWSNADAEALRAAYEAADAGEKAELLKRIDRHAPQLSFGTFLKWRREARSMSIRELGRQAGISAGQISRIESGETAKPSRDTVRALASALGGHSAPLEMVAGYADDRTVKSAVSQVSDQIRSSAAASTEVGEWLDSQIGDLEWSDPFENARRLGATLFDASVEHEVEAHRFVDAHQGDDRASNAVSEIAAAWDSLTPERQRLVRQFVADQADLSKRERRSEQKP